MTKYVSTVLFQVVPAVKTAIEQRPNLPDIRVDTGPVGGQREPTEWLAISQPTVQRSFQTATGHRLGGMDEVGSVVIAALVSRPGSGDTVIAEVRARMEEIVGEIEAAICTDPTLGGLVHWAYPSQIREADQGIDEVGTTTSHWMTCEVTVEFNARIYPGEVT
jgi:hypothetical protein